MKKCSKAVGRTADFACITSYKVGRFCLYCVLWNSHCSAPGGGCPTLAMLDNVDLCRRVRTVYSATDRSCETGRRAVGLSSLAALVH